jgi:hypothetical protein
MIVELTAAAEADLEAIGDYIAQCRMTPGSLTVPKIVHSHC